MALTQIAKIHTEDETLNRIQAELSKMNPVLASPLLNGVQVPASLKASGAVAVNHGLGRRPQGFIVVDLAAQAVVWAVPAEQTAPTKTLVLRTSADVACQLWVY